jgi:transcriptional regulator
MYVPAHFASSSIAWAHEIIEQNEFATLITVADGAPFLSHLPLLLDRSRGRNGTLLGHVAKANPQWQHLAATGTALASFVGPHAYVSPTWYAARTGAVHVPTWNYVAVQARGAVRIIDAGLPTLAVVKRLTGRYETTGAYRVDLDSEELGKMARAIVAFEIEIEELECKLKLSQNRSEADRENVMRQLASGEDPGGPGVAAWMARAGAGDEG